MEVFEAAYRLIPSLRPRIMMVGLDFPAAGGRFWDFLRPSRGSSNWAGYLGFRYAAPQATQPSPLRGSLRCAKRRLGGHRAGIFQERRFSARWRSATKIGNRHRFRLVPPIAGQPGGARNASDGSRRPQMLRAAQDWALAARNM
jgi:hypothetical protein